jgi:ribosomal protein L37AE/L43A
VKDPAQQAAWRIFRRAVRRGELVPAEHCEECAHYDYSRPLDVRWLCRGCHNRWDVKGHDGRPPAHRLTGEEISKAFAGTYVPKARREAAA